MKKNDPLLSALQARTKRTEKKTVTIPAIDIPREINVGDEVFITGTVESIQAGVATISVLAVNPPQGEDDDAEEETKTSKVLRVQTQESNVGGM